MKRGIIIVMGTLVGAVVMFVWHKFFRKTAIAADTEEEPTGI